MFASFPDIVHRVRTGESIDDSERWDAAARRISMILSANAFNGTRPLQSRLHQVKRFERCGLLEEAPDMHTEVAEKIAAERARMEILAQEKTLLPLKGVREHVLKGMGFTIPRQPRIIANAFHIVDFPAGWSIDPDVPAPVLGGSSGATIFDRNDTPKLTAFFALHQVGDYSSAWIQRIG